MTISTRANIKFRIISKTAHSIGDKVRTIAFNKPLSEIETSLIVNSEAETTPNREASIRLMVVVHFSNTVKT